jgi:hypothetical protein
VVKLLKVREWAGSGGALPVIPGKQEECEFKVILGYIVKPCLKEMKNKKKKQGNDKHKFQNSDYLLHRETEGWIRRYKLLSDVLILVWVIGAWVEHIL